MKETPAEDDKGLIAEEEERGEVAGEVEEKREERRESFPLDPPPDPNPALEFRDVGCCCGCWWSWSIFVAPLKEVARKNLERWDCWCCCCCCCCCWAWSGTRAESVWFEVVRRAFLLSFASSM